HWLTFFASLNYASVAYGLMGFASFPLFVAWLEPLVFKEERHRRDWLAAIAVVLGMAVMVSDTSWESGALAGLLLGVASGLSFALLTLANRWQGIAIPPFKLAFLQNAVACISLLPFVFSENSTFQLDKHDWWGLLLLGAVFTALSHGLFMFSLRQISTRLASMTASLEPVYGIALAYAVLNEVPTLRMLLGCAIVLAATTLATYWHRH
ncbi:MAG: EamA family transporter, partial [Burkholderiales bacterium]|nr:EamA family transporter [Burkholderiales bacterium]